MIGNRAPAFSLPGQDGKTHELSGYKGRHVVLFWCPKDDTPGFVFTHETAGCHNGLGSWHTTQIRRR
jgi:peroxiredoxin Q/BCP